MHRMVLYKLYVRASVTCLTVDLITSINYKVIIDFEKL